MERALRLAEELQRRQIKRECAGSLLAFIEHFWSVVEPVQPFVVGWALVAICKHLEAVSRGEITNLLINVPPGFAKSIVTDVFWPAWEWGALGKPSTRYVTFSYSPSLTERDNGRFAKVIQSPLYLALYGKIVTFYPYALGATKVTNRQTGWKIASSVGGVGTGERGDRVLIDDPHNVKDAESEAVRQETVRWFRESITSRLNNPETSATVIIMQRVHEDDVSGTVLSEYTGYVHLCIPMEYDPDRHCRTFTDNQDPDVDDPFWEDPRAQEGELAFPERFPRWVVARDSIRMGPSATASQFQQSPSPRGGNIIERTWWQLWPAEGYEPRGGQQLEFPPTSLRIGSVDTAYGQKDGNAYNAMTTWGIWQDQRDRPKAMLMEAWRGRWPLRGVIPDTAKTEEERKVHWGLLERVLNTVRKRQLDVLLIEDKTRGGDLADELRASLREGECMVVMIQPTGDKVARMNAVQALFADKMIYAPDRIWADMVINEVSQFPKGKFMDLADTVSQALSWLRQSGALQMGVEADVDNARRGLFQGQKVSPYDV